MGLVARTGFILETTFSINTIESLILDTSGCDDYLLLLFDNSHDSVSPLFITTWAEVCLVVPGTLV